MQSNLKDNVVFASPKCEEERTFAAAWVRKLGIKIPAVLDEFGNSTEQARSFRLQARGIAGGVGTSGTDH
jgi:hypothetical protein